MWDAKTTECLATFAPPYPDEGHNVVTLHSLAVLPSKVEHIVVCGASSDVHIMTLQGAVVKTFSSEKKGVNFVACCTSPKGEYIYCAGQVRTQTVLYA
eukprot:SAG31_NODE_3014_length_4786_cov_9.641135_6_plen_98_part_00